MLFLLYREKFILKRFILKKKFFFKGLYWRIYLWPVIYIKVFHHFKKERVERKQRNKINNFPSKLKDTFPRIPPVDWQGHLVSRDSSKISIWFFQYVYIWRKPRRRKKRTAFDNHQTLSVMFGTESKRNNILFRAVEPTKSKRTSQKTTLLY